MTPRALAERPSADKTSAVKALAGRAFAILALRLPTKFLPTLFLQTILLPTVLLGGCGYSAQSLLPTTYRKIYIEPFVNKLPITDERTELQRFATSLPRLELDATNGVINRFIFDGHLRVTPNKADADLMLTGELVNFYRQPLRLDDQGGVEEYRLNLVANLALRDVKKGALLWEENGFIGDTTYFARGSAAGTETAAVQALITDFSRRVVERTIEDW